MIGDFGILNWPTSPPPGPLPILFAIVEMRKEGLCRSRSKSSAEAKGGHSPVIIFDDVDVEKLAEMSAIRKYRNAGQGCVTPSRYYIHESIYDAFVTRFTQTASNITVDDGMASTSQMGPLAHERRIDSMEHLNYIVH